MKKELYVILSSLLLLISCAEEGPYRLGKLECNIDILMSTPTSVFVDVSVPKSDDNGLIVDEYELYLIDHPLNNNQSFNVDDAIRGSLIDNVNSDRFCSTELNPNTTYYIVLSIGIKYSETVGCEEYYYTGYSFTTSKQGDYSGLGKVSCEVVGRNNNGNTTVKVTLPPNLEFSYGSDAYLVASLSPDMSNCIKSDVASVYSSIVSTFEFNDLPEGIYYLQLNGYYRLFDVGNGEFITLDAETTLHVTQ